MKKYLLIGLLVLVGCKEVNRPSENDIEQAKKVCLESTGNPGWVYFSENSSYQGGKIDVYCSNGKVMEYYRNEVK